ncbi:Carbon-nitrogen hydrolase [Entophlyctis luteolus]|nr:Carbon-nitrogen hydrolase [Entophlyctis luteolus]
MHEGAADGGLAVALLQFAPVLGDVQANMRAADALLAAAQERRFHHLILPEMAFTGYVFHDRAHIAPHLPAAFEATRAWAQRTADAYTCSVQVGCPRVDEATNEWRNSVVVMFPAQTRRDPVVYDKHFLYEVDERWATPGPSFLSQPMRLGPREFNVGFGICMDINPWRFKAPFAKFEFGNYHLEHNTDFLSLSMAWVLGEEAEDARAAHMDTIVYWASRLQPLIVQGRRVFVAICNRIGGENGTRFCGSSCVLEINDGNVRVVGGVEGACGVAETRLLVVPIPP